MDIIEPLEEFKINNPKEICNYGTYLETDPYGYLISKASIDNISKKWLPMVMDIVNICKTNINEDNLVSILVDGSVASGVQIDNVSDLDMLIVCNDPSKLDANNLSNLDASWFVEKKEALYQKYTFTKRIHLTVWGYEDILNIQNVKKRFNLKTQATTIYGKDLLKDIDKFKPDIYLARELIKDLPQKIDKYIEDLNKAETEENIRFKCFFIAKDLVRNGFVFVMPREQKYTTSLYLSYSSFAKYYPEKKQQMYTLLYLVQNPTSNKNTLLNFINEFGKWLSDEYLRLYC